MRRWLEHWVELICVAMLLGALVAYYAAVVFGQWGQGV